MTGRDFLDKVLESVALARDLGMAPVKVNAVVIRGLNDHEIEDLAEWADTIPYEILTSISARVPREYRG